MNYPPDTRIANAVREVVTLHVRDDWPTRDVYRHVLGLAERPLIEATLKICGGNKSRTAHALGISRNTLAKLIRRHAMKL